MIEKAVACHNTLNCRTRQRRYNDSPQGFTGYETKGDRTVFHSVPHAVPHSRNEDSYPDLLRNSSDFFGPLAHLRKKHIVLDLPREWQSGFLELRKNRRENLCSSSTTVERLPGASVSLPALDRAPLHLLHWGSAKGRWERGHSQCREQASAAYRRQQKSCLVKRAGLRCG